MTNLPTVTELTSGFFGHMVSYRVTDGGSSRTVFCKKFYPMGNFTILHEVRVEASVCSERPGNTLYHNCISWTNKVFDYYKSNERYFNVGRLSGSSKTFLCYDYYGMSSINSNLINEIRSVDEEGTPIWAKTTKKMAKRQAEDWVKMVEKKCEEENREYVREKLVPAYKRHIAMGAYYENFWRRIFYVRNNRNGCVEKWIEKYLSNNNVDLTPLANMVKKSKVTFGIWDEEPEWLSKT